MSDLIKVLIVDDDPAICELIQRTLEKSGFGALTARTPDEMREQLKQASVVLLDINLPEANGIDLAREMRVSHPELAIIMVTGQVDEVDRIIGLEVGADDYVCKPFNARELVARVRSVMRRLGERTTTAAGKTIKFLDFVVDLEAHQVRRGNEPVKLTGHEFKLLVKLTDRPNKVYTREEISQEVCEREWYPYDRGIDVLVSKLRKKLEAGNEQIIQSLRGVGYQFCAPVEKLR